MKKTTDSDGSIHKSVLLKETIEGLNLHNNSIILDATFGGGGHSLEVCKIASREKIEVKIVAIDQDKRAWEKAESKFEVVGCDIHFHNANFRDIDKVLESEKVATLDGVIFDLGLSSDQIENSGRGFTFMKNEPLLMTMKENPTEEDLTARDIVNTWGEESLSNIFHGYGEERYARKIARNIVEKREEKKIETTFDLVGIIENSVPGAYKRGRIHFATKTFQALRIATNDELRTLLEGLTKGFSAIKSKGRMSVISFHSLEDRIVKRFFKQKERDGQAILINKKPIIALKEELIKNSRARSAKLRIIEKI